MSGKGLWRVMRVSVLALLLLAAMVLAGRGRAQARGHRRGRVRAQLSLIAVLFTLAVPSAALAQAKPGRGPRLEYTRGPSACLIEEDFRTEVYLITRLPIPADSPDVVKVWCEKGPMGFTCRVQSVDASGERGKIKQIDGWDCWRVGREAAIAASELMPDATCPEPQPCPAPEPCPTCPPAKPCRCPPERVCPLPPKPSENKMPDLSLYGMVILTGGLWADPGAAAAVGVEVRGDQPEGAWTAVAALALELRFAFPGGVVADQAFNPNLPTIPTRFDVGQFSTALVPCVRFKYVFGCGVIQPGAYFITGPANYKADSTFSLALGPRLGVRLPLGDRVALFGFGEALFAPVRLGFLPEESPDPNVLWLPSVAQGYGAAGVEITFP